MAKKENKNSIRALTPRQFLIKRINVYFGREIGDESYPYSSQKGVLIREIIDNSVDIIGKFSNGKGNIRVTFYKDGSVEVYDSGIGIPTEIRETSDGRPASELYLSMGVLNAGSNYDDVTDSIGTNGVGGSGAQMLSEYMKIEVYKDKKVYKLDFQDGEPGFFDDKDKFKPLGKDLTKMLIEKDKRDKTEKALFPTGTKIKFKINNNLLKSPYPYDVEDLKVRMKGTSFLKDGLTFYINDYFSETNEELVYNFGGGLNHIVDLESAQKLTNIYNISNSSTFIDDSIHIDDKGNAKNVHIEKSIKVEASFVWQNNYEYTLDSYVNTVKTRLGGVHTDAFESALVKVFNEKLLSMRGYLSKADKNVPIDQDYKEGLVAAVSVYIPEPEWTSQIKEGLAGKKALKEFTKLFTEAISEWVNDRKNQNDVKIIADKVMEAYKLRVKRKEEIELKREQKKIERTASMPIKLVDCEITHDDNSELFIAEGDSAATAIKSARNSKYQAVIPIRGKILNVLKTTLKASLANQEIQDLIKCMDAGIGDEYNHDEARYQRIIIGSDADPDGDQIACLLIVAFWKLFPDAFAKKAVYRMLTPLYIIETKDGPIYCLNSEEKDEALATLGNKKYKITRAKGLGETGAKALKFTGTDPATRRIQQITIDDVKEAERMLDTVMGDNIEARKEWLESNPIDFEE